MFVHDSVVKKMPEDHKLQVVNAANRGIIRMIDVHGYHIDFLGNQETDLVKVGHRDIVK